MCGRIHVLNILGFVKQLSQHSSIHQSGSYAAITLLRSSVIPSAKERADFA